MKIIQHILTNSGQTWKRTADRRGKNSGQTRKEDYELYLITTEVTQDSQKDLL